MSKLIINKEQRKSFINRNIYGHFSEHLGRCIYNGLFVGEDSEIPNNKGMRSDVVEAYVKLKFRFYVGREAVSLMSIIGKTVLVRRNSVRR
jgi:alpha-L-arabinofuranosidase